MINYQQRINGYFVYNRENVIIPRDDWASLNSQTTWFSWSISSVKWVFTKMLSYAPVAVTYAKREIDPETQFIHLSQVQVSSNNFRSGQFRGRYDEISLMLSES